MHVKWNLWDKKRFIPLSAGGCSLWWNLLLWGFSEMQVVQFRLQSGVLHHFKLGFMREMKIVHVLTVFFYAAHRLLVFATDFMAEWYELHFNIVLMRYTFLYTAPSPSSITRNHVHLFKLFPLVFRTYELIPVNNTTAKRKPFFSFHNLIFS